MSLSSRHYIFMLMPATCSRRGPFLPCDALVGQLGPAGPSQLRPRVLRSFFRLLCRMRNSRRSGRNKVVGPLLPDAGAHAHDARTPPPPPPLPAAGEVSAATSSAALRNSWRSSASSPTPAPMPTTHRTAPPPPPLPAAGGVSAAASSTAHRNSRRSLPPLRLPRSQVTTHDTLYGSTTPAASRCQHARAHSQFSSRPGTLSPAPSKYAQIVQKVGFPSQLGSRYCCSAAMRVKLGNFHSS